MRCAQPRGRLYESTGLRRAAPIESSDGRGDSTRRRRRMAGEGPMKTIVYVLGVLLIVVAAIYLLMPADSLPAFLPGHEAGLMRPRTKHGLAAGAVGIVLLVVGWVLGRRT